MEAARGHVEDEMRDAFRALDKLVRELEHCDDVDLLNEFRQHPGAMLLRQWLALPSPPKDSPNG